MLLKILLLQVMSIGLITVPIKAQDSLVAIPELYMEDNDKAVMNSIWNMAGFPGDQGGPTEVDRKFMATLGNAVPVLLQQMPFVGGMMPNLYQTTNNNQQHKQITQTGGTYTGSPTTINYKVLPKPPNSELDSSEEDDSPGLIANRRTLHPENVDLEITNDNDIETNAGYPTENLETSPQNLETMNLPMERMQRMMQYKGADDSVHINKKSRNFLRRNSHQSVDDGKQSHDSTADVDNNRSRMRKNNNPTITPNSHMEIPKHYMHKKKYNRKTANTTRNSETSTHHPTVTNYKHTKKRKESNRKSEKSPEISRYYEMVDNNEKYTCKCNLMRRKSEELNARKSNTERSMEHRHEPVFNCTKMCNVTKENETDTTEKDNLRLRSRHDKVKYHKDKRDNDGDEAGEEAPVKPKVTRARKYRHKHRSQQYKAVTEKEDILINYPEVTEDEQIYLPTENQFAINDEYRSSIDPVQAYADESAYRPVVNPMFGYPDEVESDPEMDPMRRFPDEPDYGGDTAMDPVNRYATEPDYQQSVPPMNSYVDDFDYRAVDDVNPSDYMAGSPVEVLHNVEGYNPFMHQYPNDPQDYMYEETQDMHPAT